MNDYRIRIKKCMTDSQRIYIDLDYNIIVNGPNVLFKLRHVQLDVLDKFLDLFYPMIPISKDRSNITYWAQSKEIRAGILIQKQCEFLEEENMFYKLHANYNNYMNKFCINTLMDFKDEMATRMRVSRYRSYNISQTTDTQREAIADIYKEAMHQADNLVEK